mgnify:CR=1 FL=1
MCDLKGSKDSPCKQLMGFSARDVFPVEGHCPRVRGMDTGDDVEERSLPGAVWPYQPGNTPLLDRQRSILNGMDTAELFVKVLNIQQLKCNRQKKTARVIPGRSLEV